jgi:hypothetical protein
MGPSESLLADELERLIHSAVLRIEHQNLHVAKSPASPHQVLVAEQVLTDMVAGLQKLRLRRAQFD